jgi:very-short-patch-repair endonuclease
MDIPLARRRALRRECTDAEAALWAHLRAKRFAGFKFRRQHPCGPYILDFYCASGRLAIELDGGQHFDPVVRAYDERRTAFLHRHRITVLRFATDLVFREPAAVLEVIAGALGLFDGPSP